MSRQRAKSLLVHYIGLDNELQPDNYSEIEDIVDEIVDAAVSETIAKLHERGLIHPTFGAAK